jgi:HD-GYP domain-containing protein (c-di-GMP phosphodiesterase class II)
MPLRTSSGATLGVLQLINAMDERGRPRDRFSEADESLLSHFASMATVAIDRSELMKNIVRRMLLMAHAHDEAETWLHVTRVAECSAVLFDEWARRRGLMEGSAFERQRDRLRNAAKMHDLGKVGISTELLRKPGPLTPAEYEQMKSHVVIGARLFIDHPTEFDEAARDVALNHHERWDGTGYPGHVDLAGAPLLDPSSNQPRRGGKRGEEIPLFARIVALADVYDALSHRRTYKEAWDEKRVLNTIRSEKGQHFDPELVEIFFERLPAIREVREAHPG